MQTNREPRPAGDNTLLTVGFILRTSDKYNVRDGMWLENFVKNIIL